jgi:hypothetical protein
MRSRGRPPRAEDPEIKREDAAIGSTCHHLVMWGYPRRGRTLVAVREAARDRFPHRRINGAGIEKIYRLWLIDNAITPHRWRFTTKTLQERAPRATPLKRLALMLIWTDDQHPKRERFIERDYDGTPIDFLLEGDRELSPRGIRAELDAPSIERK